MKKTTLTRMGLAFCTVCCTVAAITLFAKGDISAGVCGLIMAAALAYFAIRKRGQAKMQSFNSRSRAKPPRRLPSKKGRSVYISKKAARNITAIKSVRE